MIFRSPSNTYRLLAGVALRIHAIVIFADAVAEEVDPVPGRTTVGPVSRIYRSFSGAISTIGQIILRHSAPAP
jgi:hypothetical protein